MLICGIDEAGRGPIIGPMVIAGILIDERNLPKLEKLGVKDSKLLTPLRRESLFEKIKKISKNHKIIIIEPGEVDEALESDSLNLNWLEAYKSAEIINELNPDKAIIDSPSNNCDAYKKYVLGLLKNKKIELIVEHKADLNYVACSAASILAKVTRDREIEEIKKRIGNNFGSGYLSDPLTQVFFEKNFDKHPEIFRKTWLPYKKLKEAKQQKILSDFQEVVSMGSKNKDIYSEEGRDELLENDEISPAEEGFMEGASGLGQGAKCRKCGKILGDYKDVFEKEVHGKIYMFCSKKCSDQYFKNQKKKRNE